MRVSSVHIVALGVALGGCAFIDPVWEFTTAGDLDGGVSDAAMDAGVPVDVGPPRDGGPPVDTGPIEDAGPVLDAGPLVDGGPLVDSGPVGVGVCRVCEFGTDLGCPTGYACVVDDATDPMCNWCVERTGDDFAEGQSCADGRECAQGVDCIAGRCRTFCQDTSECAEETCFTFSADPPTGWCVGADCDVFAGTGCDSGTVCGLFAGFLEPTEFIAICAAGMHGASQVGQACDPNDRLSCEAGAICLDSGANGAECFALCTDGAPCQAAGRACGGIGTLAGATIGACLMQCADDSECTGSFSRCDTAVGFCVPQ